MSDNNIFSPPTGGDDDHQPNLEDIKLETLVGENQKYKTPDDLAKAYAHADARIAAQNEKLTKAEAELKVLKELMETRSNKKEPPVDPKDNGDPDDSRSNQPDPANNQPDSRKTVVEEKDLNTLIREQLEEADKEKAFSTNVNTVSEKLEKYYGGAREAQAAINNKAKELNVSVDWLMDVAGRSPTAFFGTIGLDQRSLSTPSSGGDVNTAAFSRDKSRKNFAYYENLRKTDSKSYYSAAVQKEMFNEARNQGPQFYT